MKPRRVQPGARGSADRGNSTLNRTLPRDRRLAQGHLTSLQRLETHVDGWERLLSWLDAHQQKGDL
jgi:hypothetical protein